MPDINVAGFPNGEVVSRIHATIHVEKGVYSIEDVGSANGTSLNGMALTPGTPYRLRTGDKICLGKGELVTFIFKI
jgi:pSer/pThr/pTyr-binding forkhead associated (FHA) protein